MSTEPRRQSASLVLTRREPYRAAQEHTVRSFRPSATTTAGFTDANVDATAVGLMVIPEDGTLRSQPRQIKSVSGTTAAVDAAWATVGAVSAIRAWLPNDIPVRVTTADAAGPFDVISSPHAGLAAQPDNFCQGDGYYLIGISGANAGMAKLVTTFTSSTGTYVAGANVATAVGDLFALRKVVRSPVPAKAMVKPKTIERTSIGMGDQGADMPIVLSNEGSFSIELEQRPIVTAGAAAVQASQPIELGDILGDHFDQTKDTGGLISAIDATSITTSNGVFHVNNFVLLNNGKVAQILAISSAPVISAYGAGQAGFALVTVPSTAYGGVCYTRKQQGSECFTRTWEDYEGGKTLKKLQSSMPTLNILINRQDTLRFQFAYTSMEAWQYNVDRPVALGAAFPLSEPDLGVPTPGIGARCIIDGVTIGVTSLSLNTGLKPIPRPGLFGAAQSDGYLMDFEAPKLQLKLYADIDDTAGFRAVMDRLQSRIPMHFLYQKGTAPKETFCIGIPALTYTGGVFDYEDGQLVAQMEATAVTPRLAVDHTNTALYPTTTYPGLRELSIGWL